MTKKPKTSKDAANKVVKNIRRKTRQTYSSEEKIRIVLARHIHQQVPVRDFCQFFINFRVNIHDEIRALCNGVEADCDEYVAAFSNIHWVKVNWIRVFKRCIVQFKARVVGLVANPSDFLTVARPHPISSATKGQPNLRLIATVELRQE